MPSHPHHSPKKGQLFSLIFFFASKNSKLDQYLHLKLGENRKKGCILVEGLHTCHPVSTSIDAVLKICNIVLVYFFEPTSIQIRYLHNNGVNEVGYSSEKAVMWYNYNIFHEFLSN